MIFRRATENNALIPAIVAALAFYPDVMAFPVKGEGAHGKRLVVPKGTADILGIRAKCLHEGQDHVRGTHLRCFRQVGLGFAIETKWTHRPTCKCDSCEAQRTWRGEWEKRGGLYILARSPQEAIDGLMGRRAA
jgi:hypothetical protein